jgi:phospholipid transport system substrate-binding protein
MLVASNRVPGTRVCPAFGQCKGGEKMKAVPSDPSRSVIRINRRALLSHAAAAVGIMAILAGSFAARAADPDALTDPIKQLNAALLAAMKVGQSTPFAQRYAMVAPAVQRAFDLDAVLRAAVGLSWDSLPGDQKAALARTFQRYTVSNYTANFDSYNGQIFRVLPETRTLSNGEVAVRTQIVRRNDSPVEIDYVMRQTALGWKAVDVLSDGSISQVAVQRSDFRRFMTSGGAPALRAGLERKVASLSNGALA